MNKKWLSQAPSNIALIKYMGKKDYQTNIPANPSLSYTLPNLLSFVELEAVAGQTDTWETLEIPGSKPFDLSQAGQTRFLKHLQLLKELFDYQGAFIVRSTNNFPMGTGLASSASSFAALTKCACLALSELQGRPLLSIDEQAQLSRLGSGSSCRSFYAPWALWQETDVKAIDLAYPELDHHVIIINDAEKEISSKAAHLAIKTSPDYAFRPARATERLKSLIQAMQNKDWSQMYKLCWDEFMDMHHIFQTCTQAFTYFNEKTEQALNDVQNFWHEHQDGPLVTMDAGPNIHLLFRPDQKQMAQFYCHEYLVNQYDFL